MKRLNERLSDFKNALKRLEESLNENMISSTIRDGIIQRFEFSYELCWNSIKDFMKFQGIEDVKSPRMAFKEAFQFNLINEEEADLALEMLQDRNLTSHTYNEYLAEEIYNKIKSKYYDLLKTIYLKLEIMVKK